ncbi:MAG TPA: response regulator [Vicinamibacterales bacterium]|nr:response regulator [Vicinamibacterales bacterium]
MSTVLVIEDDPDMREIERATLGSAGHDVVVATNGKEGLEALERQRPCIIVLDLMMPVMDGLTFLAEKTRRGLAEDVPVLCVTAGGEEMTNHALHLGARECLHKPADFDELCAKVEHYCARPPR